MSDSLFDVGELHGLGRSGWRPPSELPSIAGRGIKRIAIDVETRDPDLKVSGPGVRTGGYIVGIAVGIEDGPRYYLPIRHEDASDNLDPRLVIEWARAELNAFDGAVTGAKLDYDLDFLAEVGVTFEAATRFDDVLLAEPIIDEWQRSYSLDSTAERRLGERKDEGRLREVAAAMGWTTNDAVKSNLWRLPGRDVGPYAEADVDLPLRILPIQTKILEADDQLHVYELERRLIPVVVAMRRRGVRVDVERAVRVREQLVVERDEWLRKLRRLAGPGAELMQPETFVRALRDRGLEPPSTPKTNKPSIKKEWLDSHRGDDLVDAILGGRKIETTINTFLDGHVLGHAVNGRIHCQFHQLKGDAGGTIARFSSSDPNLQNLPSRDERIGPLVRGIFVPEEGEDWERMDYSQCEYRVLAEVAVGRGAEEVRRTYVENPATDYHNIVGAMMGVDPEDKIKRKRVKNTNFAKVNGAQAKKLAATFGCTVPEAEAFLVEYDRKLPFVTDTMNHFMRIANEVGVVKSLFDRKQRFVHWEPRNNWGENKRPGLLRDEAIAAYGHAIQRSMTHAAVNRVLQTSNADFMKRAMVEGWEQGVCRVIGAYLLTVHDELDDSVPRTSEGREASDHLKRIMEGVCPKMRVPLLVDASIGPDWGACS